MLNQSFTRTAAAGAIAAASALSIPVKEAEAAVMEFSFYGSLTRVDPLFASPDLHVGKGFTYVMRVNMDAPDYHSSNLQGRYDALRSWRFTAGDVVVTRNAGIPDSRITVYNNMPYDGLTWTSPSSDFSLQSGQFNNYSQLGALQTQFTDFMFGSPAYATDSLTEAFTSGALMNFPTKEIRLDGALSLIVGSVDGLSMVVVPPRIIVTNFMATGPFNDRLRPIQATPFDPDGGGGCPNCAHGGPDDPGGPTPAPGTVALLGIAAAAAGMRRRRDPAPEL